MTETREQQYRSIRVNVTFEKYDIGRIDDFVGKDKPFSSRAALVQRATLRFLDYLENEK